MAVYIESVIYLSRLNTEVKRSITFMEMWSGLHVLVVP
jgi:hypothetical protein